MERPAIPEDFPRSANLGAVPGAQPKVLARQEGGSFLAGPQEAEIQARYAMCEDLAQQLLRYSARKNVEYPEWTREQLQAKVAAGVQAKAFGWGLSSAETAWVLQRFVVLGAGGAPAGGPTS